MSDTCPLTERVQALRSLDPIVRAGLVAEEARDVAGRQASVLDALVAEIKHLRTLNAEQEERLSSSGRVGW